MRSRTPLATAALSTLALLLGLTGCSSTPDRSRGTARTLTVYAAASLAGAFATLAHDFEAEHDGVTVRLNTGGSSTLVAQVAEGAPADVLATADETTMQTAQTGGLVDAPRVFATNTLELVVPPDNPAKITSLAGAAKAGVKLVVCAPEVPCGAAAVAVAKQAGVTLRPVSEEQSVSDVLAKVAAGEADAGLVYVTDVRAAGSAVQGIVVPEAAAVVNSYPIGLLTGAAEPELAIEFQHLVVGPRGREVLAAAGFGLPAQ